MIDKMPIIEIFGPTIQGEGMVMGRKTMFIRTAGCDYSCNWCDSAYTWNGKEKAKLLTAKEVFSKIMTLGKKDGQLNFNHVTITGGNPALIKQPMKDFIQMLHTENIKVGLETQGTIYQDWFTYVNDLTISPKPPSSGMKTDWAQLDFIVDQLEKKNVNYSFKIVVFDDLDFEYANNIYEKYKYTRTKFYLSVGNDNYKEKGNISERLLKKLDWLWGKVLHSPDANDFIPLPQLHTLVWMNKRGV